MWISILILLSFSLTACTPPATNKAPFILLFNGTGASPNDVAAIEMILKDRQLAYATADSQQLNGMSQSQLAAYRLLIVPGGNYIKLGDSMSPSTAANVRSAVENGLNYLGICAGGLLAGDGSHNNFNLTSGVKFDFYAVVNQGVHKTVAAINGVDAPPLEHFWEDGPQFTGWGEVVGKYPDGMPAVVQGTVGQGWVVLCGTHPEAPENWRNGMKFTTPVSFTQAYAAKLIDAALNRKPLPHF